MFETEGDEALTAEVRKRLVDAHESRENSRQESVLLDRLIEAHRMDLPEAMVEEQVRARLAQVRSELEAQGVPAEQIPEPDQEQECSQPEEAPDQSSPLTESGISSATRTIGMPVCVFRCISWQALGRSSQP